VLVKMREGEIDSRRFDNTPGTWKHRTTELFNERHGLSALFCSGFPTRCRLRGVYARGIAQSLRPNRIRK
jgi:hypothetical protein